MIFKNTDNIFRIASCIPCFSNKLACFFFVLSSFFFLQLWFSSSSRMGRLYVKNRPYKLNVKSKLKPIPRIGVVLYFCIFVKSF